MADADNSAVDLAGVTFQAINPGVPLNLVPQFGPHRCGVINFSVDGTYTTDDTEVITYLREQCSHLCVELEFEEQKVLVGKAKQSAAQIGAAVAKRPGPAQLGVK
jgi:hypothetical protein